MIQKYSYALISILTCATESIVTELMFILYGIPTVLYGMLAVPISGAVLLAIFHYGMKQQITVIKEWKLLLAVGFVFVINEVMWYDAVGHIGASKTVLITAPLETILIVVLAYIFLRERLAKMQIIGVCSVVVGVMIAISLTTFRSNTIFGIGEIESIITAIAVATATILSVGPLKRHGAYQTTAFYLIVSGLMMQSLWFISPDELQIHHHQQQSIIITNMLLFLLPSLLIPLIVFLPQDISIIKVGAALTEPIVITNIILVVVLQAILFYSHIPVALPENLALAFLGGAISIVGMGVIMKEEKKRK